ncbi:MAG: apolipoprotein N-acyltransferase [Sulfitobacter sp.]
MTQGWGARLLPVALGAMAALGQAPFNLPVVMIAGLAAVIYLSRSKATPRAMALLGFSFGFGYFAVALHWIISPFLVDAARHGWMAPFAVVLMAAGGALFWAVAFWSVRRLSDRGWMIVPCWAGVELLRAYIFTGFPWAAPAQSMVDGLLGQTLAWIGPHGLNFVIILMATAVATARGWPLRIALLALAALAIKLPPMTDPAPLSDTVLRLIQPNAPQADKWNPDKIETFYTRQLTFTAAPSDPVLGAPDAVIWSETAIPWALNRSGVILEEIAAAAGGIPVILGAQRSQEGRYYNALAVLGRQGQVTQTYDKHHLVPFGEYVPLGDFAARFGFYGMAPQHGAGFSAGEGAALLDLGPLGRALPLICYEAVFAQDVNAAPARADFIIHATNDAWFGKNAGPQQHLAQARMRAIEQGLPVARAANTGISAMIDPAGRVLQQLALNHAGYIDAALPVPRAPTLYSRTGDAPIAVVLTMLLACAAFQAARKRRSIGKSD